MKFTTIVELINDKLAGEMLSYNTIRPFLDAVIDDINMGLNAKYPSFSYINSSSGLTDDIIYDYFPDRYIRSVVVVGAAYKFYVTDEEGIDTAQAYGWEYKQNLAYMVRDYSNSVATEFQADFQGYVTSTDNSMSFPTDTPLEDPNGLMRYVEGPQGAQGPIGPQGETGPRGARGYTGEAGAKGDPGVKGDPGQQGPQGVQGQMGIKGDTGLRGERGIQGQQGVKGDTGNSGVYLGEVEPVDPDINVWVDPTGSVILGSEAIIQYGDVFVNSGTPINLLEDGGFEIRDDDTANAILFIAPNGRPLIYN